MISSCGFECRDSRDYDWHGLKRGSEKFALFQYTESGGGMLEYEGTRRPVGEGQALLLHIPHQHRYWWPRGGRPWRFFFLCLYGREALRLLRQIEERRGPLLHIAVNSRSLELGRRIVERGVERGFDSEFEVSAQAYQFVMALSDELLNRNPEGKETRPFQNVVTFCREHLSESIGVEQMAAVAGFSRFHFSRLFKEAYGIPPGLFLAHMRIRIASQWLREEGSRSIKEIARRAGFRDANYFARAFRSVAGVSPGNFRRNGMY